MVPRPLRFVATVVSLLAAVPGTAVQVQMQMGMNPIRKVVNLLQAMQRKVDEEGQKEQELFEKYLCYCKTGTGDLSASIEAAETKGPALTSSIEASEGKLAQAQEDLKSAKSGREAAKSDLEEASALRQKESAAFAKEKADASANIAAMEKAVAALEKGMGSSFLETGFAKTLRAFAQVDSEHFEDADRQVVLSFLAGSGSDEYAPASGEITGVLKQMHETMVKFLADSTASEESAITSHEELVNAKEKEIEAQTSTIEAKTQQIGELGVGIEQMKEDLSDTAATLVADKQYLAELSKSCSSKNAEWEERSKARSEELVALADTIKVLNDDDALQLFKQTLPRPSASFLQVAVSSKEVRDRAQEVVRVARKRASGHSKAGLSALLLALSGKKALNQGTFDKVVAMVDDMVTVLAQEQQDDDSKKEYCGTEFDQSDDQKKALERTVSETDNTIATAKEALSTLTEDIAAMTADISKLDKAVAEATDQRKQENKQYKEVLASDTAAKEVLAFAKNRLNKFYNAKLFKAAPKRELSSEDRIASSMSGTEPPTPPPGGIADTGITALVQVHAQTHRGAPPPPPETFGAYTKKSEESSGVIEMLDILTRDLDKEMTECKVDENNAQEEYEAMMRESAEKRTADSKSLTEKEAAKAGIEAELHGHEEERTSTAKELAATVKYIQSLHRECDWLMQYYDTRKEARAGEIESLKKAKAVLSGADYSFLQTGLARRVMLRHRL